MAVIAAESVLIAGAVTAAVWAGWQGICAISEAIDDAEPQALDPPDIAKCEKMYDDEAQHCEGLDASNHAKNKCYESAMERYAACIRGKRLPQLVDWLR